MTVAAEHLQTAAFSRAGARAAFDRHSGSPALAPAAFSTAAATAETVALLAVASAVAKLLDCGPGVFATSAILAVALMQAMGLYRPASLNAPRRALARILFAWTVAVAGAVALFHFSSGVAVDYSAMGFFFSAGLLSLALTRPMLAEATQALRRNGYLQRNAIIYGSGGSGDALIETLAGDLNSDVRICGIFDDRGDDRTGNSPSYAPVLGNIEDLKTFVRTHHVDMLIMALPLAAEARVAMLAQRVTELPIDIRLAATSSMLRFHKSAYSYIGSVPVIDLSRRPISGWNAAAKWLFDKLIASLAILMLAPVMLAVAIAVKLESKGPAIFRQKRYGFNNELIEVFKFRSMYTDRTDASAAKLVTKNDPRVTRVGRIIRKTSLDELPQLFNVLLGTLSLVGPRPHATQAKAADRLYPDVVDGYFARHKVKPGITGWAQINGWRGETDTAEKIQKRVEFDLAYIENWSVWFDLCILVKTPRALLSTKNAY